MTDLDRIRRFTRSFVSRMGLLTQNYLGTGHPVSEVRVLYELEDAGGISARELAQHLNMDEGYVSRLIARLCDQGFVSRKPDPRDARIRQLSLTQAGKSFVAPLHAASREDLQQRLSHLSPTAIGDLARDLDLARQRIEPRNGEVRLRDLEIGDAGWVIENHARAYARDEGFDHSFEALVAEVMVDFMRTHDPQKERAFIADRNGQRLGSIFCVQSQAENSAKIRLFFLMPEARGLGLGKTMLEACLEFARGAGYQRLHLATHESHKAACALYRKTGFACTRSEPVRSFGVDLVEQSWEITL